MHSEVKAAMAVLKAAFPEAEISLPTVRVYCSALEELAARVIATETLLASLDGDGEEALLQEQQKKIRWGGRRRRRSAANKP